MNTELQPRTFLMENVPPLISQAKFRPLWSEFKRRAREGGYDLTADVLDACNYGVPQRRRRAFVVGMRHGAIEGRFQFPVPTHWPIVSKVDGREIDMLESGREDDDEGEEEEIEIAAQASDDDADLDGDREAEQAPLPGMESLDADWCPRCQSRDRLEPGCLFPHRGGDPQGYQKVCRCGGAVRGTYCYPHGRWT